MENYVLHQSQNFRVYESVDDVARHGPYNVIVVGSGMGGGALVRQLLTNSTADKKVLLIEKGTITFPTHVLNTSRPHFDHDGAKPGRGRDNEVMFDNIKVPYTLAQSTKETPRKYVGGAINALGGRSLFWSLETPFIERKAAQAYFPPSIVKDLWGEGETKDSGLIRAVRVMTNSPPNHIDFPGGFDQDIKFTGDEQKLKRAITDYKGGVIQAVQVGAEFGSKPNPYYFPQGAYSTTDYLLDKALSRDLRLTILLGQEVRDVTFVDQKVDQLNFQDPKEKNSPSLKVGNAQVVLAAGTIDTPAIALRSKLDDHMPKDHKGLIGLGLTDHEIWTAKSSKLKGSQTLELAVTVEIENHPALLTVCTNAEKFFNHGFANGKGQSASGTDPSNVLNVFLAFQQELDPSSKVQLADPAPKSPKKSDPRLSINYQPMGNPIVVAVKKLMTEIFTEFGIKDSPITRLEGFGTVAHETGTMRVEGPKGKGVVNDQLQVHGINNLFVCDLSVFPFSPGPNPSLTLTALALRLGDHLAPPKTLAKKWGENQIV
ncbi:hypothetical protein MMC31_000244 [Peltigera leucophlebia]|nr:hypothetical protein [Peltigera leucophlebia]